MIGGDILMPPGGITKTDVWSTPRDLFAVLDMEFGFTLDPCANAENATCARFFTEHENGLLRSWAEEVVFMNPPYSQCEAWMRKAYGEAKNEGATAVCLVPARTDTAWWHDFAMKGEIRLLRGRLRFGNAKANAPFPSAIIVFRPGSFALSSMCRPEGWRS